MRALIRTCRATCHIMPELCISATILVIQIVPVIKPIPIPSLFLQKICPFNRKPQFLSQGLIHEIRVTMLRIASAPCLATLQYIPIMRHSLWMNP